MKCRDQLEPESIQKCRGLCLNGDMRLDNVTTNGDVLVTETSSSPQLDSDINNEILNLLIPSDPGRPDSFVEDKIQPDNLKVVEMQLVTDHPLVDSNDIEQADEAYQMSHAQKKMSIHIGEDAANFLAKLQADQPTDHHDESSVDLSKIKPSFKWKIGLWTRVTLIPFVSQFQLMASFTL